VRVVALVIAAIYSSASAETSNRFLGLPPQPAATADAAIVEIGRRLFFDARLSADGRVSCASCHDPKKGFTDGLVVARGIDNRAGTRNTPSLWNVAYNASLFWEGRRSSLEEQAGDPFVNPREHGLANLSALVSLVRKDAHYSTDLSQALKITPDRIAPVHVVGALAAFERTLLLGDSALDRYLYGKQTAALSPAAARGLKLFRGRAQCASCHLIGTESALLTDGQFHAIGIGQETLGANLARVSMRVAKASATELDALIGADATVGSLGRFLVTRDPRDIGKFRTPSLRNVALTAPYMHDGSVATLEEAVDSEVYYRSTERGEPLILTPAEKSDIVAFLGSLTSAGAQSYISDDGAARP